ncbi:MAG TPA: sulfotransferase [Holophagaceae bacterium]|nr:sulfotransferase [Holophagaceae bacterium]
MAHTPFFVTGVPKSGTTWLGKLLDAHPQINCKGEACIHQFIRSLFQIGNEYNRMLENRAGKFSDLNEFPTMTEADIHEIGRFFVEQRLRTIADPHKPELTWVGEKDPFHMAYLPILNAEFPEAKVIHIIRDGRAVVVSAWHHTLQLNPEAAKAAGFDRFMDEAAGNWADMIRRAWETRGILGDRYLELRYEALLADPEGELAKVLTFLGARAGEEVKACVEAASFQKLAKGREQGQEDKQSFFRKGISDDWKTFMNAGQIQRFDGRAKGMLKALGYLD